MAQGVGVMTWLLFAKQAYISETFLNLQWLHFTTLVANSLLCINVFVVSGW